MTRQKNQQRNVKPKLSEDLNFGTHALISLDNSEKKKENVVLGLQICHDSEVEIVRPGDCVVVTGPSSNYIGRVSSFYKNKYCDEINACLYWFYNINEIPKRLRPSVVLPNELFLSVPFKAFSIDATTIDRKCHVEWVAPDSAQDKSLEDDRFFYRKSFDGKILKDLYSPDNELGKLTGESNQPNTMGKRSRQTPSRYRSTNFTEKESDCGDDCESKKSNSPKKKLKSAPNKKIASAPQINLSPRTVTSSILKPTLQRIPLSTGSPLSASSFGKMEASAVVLDILNGKTAAASLINQKAPAIKRFEKNAGKNCKRALLDTNGSYESKHDSEHFSNMNGSGENINSSKTNRKGILPLSNNKDSDDEVHPLNVQGRKLPSVNPHSSPKLSNYKKKCKESVVSQDHEYSSDEIQPLSTYTSKAMGVPQDIKLEKESKLQTPKKVKNSYPTTPSMRCLSTRQSPRLQHKTSVTNYDEFTESSDEDSVSEFSSGSASSGDDSFEHEHDDPLNPVKKSVKQNKNLGRRGKSVKITLSHSNLEYIPSRKTPVRLATGGLEKSRERLHVSTVPDCLPCRENEFQEIYTFVEGKIRSGGGGCMYVSGVPGTGKTATVQEVMSCLRQSSENGDLPNFTYADINGMRLTEPRQAYVQLLWHLNHQKATADHASEILSKLFSQRRKVPAVVLADELDLLWTRKQDVLYHLFDWPTHRHAKLIVVAIANTMDLPERIMINRVKSRLGLTRLTFRPYSFKQLQEIVASRLQSLNTFQSDAIQLASRKVAAVSGDARRCLDICRRATEIAEGKKKKIVGIEQVHEALQEMFATPMIKTIRACSNQEKLFLKAVASEFHRSGMEEATLAMIIHQHTALCQLEGASPISVSTVVCISHRLAASRVILLEGGQRDLYSRVRLNVSVDDVLFALKS